MNYKHSISSVASGDVAGKVPEIETSAAPLPPSPIPSAAPPPPPPPPTKVPADFAASAAMAKDILALGTDGEEKASAPPPPPAQPGALATVAGVTQPRAVPDLDMPSSTAERSESSPMAPDFFFSSSKHKSARIKSARHKPPRSRSKAKLFKITR